MASSGPESRTAPTAGPALATVTMRYWAAARAAAGVDSETRTGATVGEVVDAAVAAHPDLARVARVASLPARRAQGRP